MSQYPSDPFRRCAANRDPEEEALGWVVRMASGDVTSEDRAEFSAWRGDRENAIAYDRATRLWNGVGPILEQQEAAGWPMVSTFKTAAVEPVSGNSTPSQQRPRPLYRFAALAAALLLMICGSVGYIHVWQYDETSGSAVRGTLKLADGSSVTMGPESAFNADFSNGGRHISLARGEAYFDVIHDAARPFVVSSGNGVIRVLGTAFSVRKGDHENVTVTVTRGRVQVTSGANSATLTPDHQIGFGQNGLGPIRAVNASTALAWMRGRLIMEDRPLGDVLAELDRYKPGMILLLNEEASQRRINAVIDLNKTDSWLTALASSQGLALTRIGSLTIIR